MPSTSPPAYSFESKGDSRLLLISNRLPITIKRSEDGGYDFSMSSGGLVSGLSGLSKSTTFQWYGWPGIEVPEDEAGPLKQRLKEEYNAIPIFIDDELADRHYNGFSSKVFLAYPINLLIVKTRSFGHCSTTTLARSHSMSLHGVHISKQIVSLPGPSPRTYKMVILSGSMIII